MVQWNGLGGEGNPVRTVLAPSAVAGLAPALLVMTLFVLVMTDGSNDRHRDGFDFLRGLAYGAPFAVLVWAASTAVLAALLITFRRHAGSGTGRREPLDHTRR